MCRFVDGPVLGIETSGSLTGAALWGEGRLLAESSVDARASSAEVLLDQVQQILRGHGLRAGDLRRIGVALGPGSFTGIRVGLSAARGLAWGAKVAAVGVPSHEALAWPWRNLDREIVLMSGLRRGEVYFEVGRWEGDRWRPSHAGASVPVEAALATLPRLSSAGRLLFVGEAVDSLRERLTDPSRLGDWVADPLSRFRRPATVACLAALAGAEERSESDLEGLVPLYLRGADARRPGAPR